MSESKEKRPRFGPSRTLWRPEELRKDDAKADKAYRVGVLRTACCVVRIQYARKLREEEAEHGEHGEKK